MKILSRTSDGLKRCYVVLISPEEVEVAIIEKLKELAKKVRLDGFRPGKVPLDIVQRMHGDGVREESIKNLVTNTSKKIFKDENIKISFNFSTDISKQDDSGVEFSLKFEIIPEIELKDFSSIELVKHVAKVTEKETNEVFDEIRKNHKNWVEESPNTKADHGHKVVVDLLVKTKLKKQKDDSVKDLEIAIGDANVIEDFWKPMLGVKISDVKEFTVNYPPNMRDKALSGKTIEYVATVKKILKSEEHKLDDAFAKSLGYEDFKKLHAWAQSRAVAKYEQISKDVLKRDLLEKLSDIYTFEVPKNMLDVEISEVKRQISEEAAKIGKEMTEEIQNECMKIAERRVRLGFVIAEISKKEKISVSNAEVAKAIKSIAMMYPGREKMIWDMYSRGDAVNAIAGPMLESKVVEFLFGIIKTKEKHCSPKELVELDEEPFDFFKDGNVSKKKEVKASSEKKPAKKNEETEKKTRKKKDSE